MRPSPVSCALSVLACALVPMVLPAQRPRVSFEPRVSGLPDATVWGRTTTSATMPSFDSTSTITMSRIVKLERTPVSMVGGRLVLTPVSGRWRFGVDGGIGGGSMRAYVREETYSPRSDPWLPDGCCRGYRSYGRSRVPLALAQLGVSVERPMRWKGIGVDAGAGAMGQQLRTRTISVVDDPFTGWFRDITHYRTVYDPALQGSIAIGPASGRGAGLRLAMRSTHVWRHARLANDFLAGYRNSLTDASGRQWQWQPELGLSWQVPAMSRGPRTP